MITEILNSQFDGVIVEGSHQRLENKCCALELLSVVKNIKWTDDPKAVRCFDFRPINDIKVNDKLRTEWMIKMLEVYKDSLDWPLEKQKKVIEKIIILTTQLLISNLSTILPEDICELYKKIDTLEKARDAANAAAYAANYAAADAINYAAADAVYAAANSAAYAANSAAYAAAYAANSAANYAAYYAAYSDAANSAAYAAYATNYAANSAAYSAAYSANSAASTISREKVFVEACKIWLESVEENDKS